MVAFVRPLSAVGSRSQIAKSVPTPARCSAVKEDQHGKKVVVIGLAASGRAAAKLALARGANVVGMDINHGTIPLEADCPGYGPARLRTELGEHCPRTLLSADLLVISPGVPLSSPAVAQALRQGVPALSELAYAAEVFPKDFPMAAVTGTNGKSTVTTFTGQLLHSSGLRPFVGGNLGLPLSVGALALLRNRSMFDCAVVECSSFQLELPGRFHPRVGVVLNLTPDHLDRHGTMESYGRAKCGIFARMGPRDLAVLPEGDPLLARLAAEAGGSPSRAYLGALPGAMYDPEQKACLLRLPPGCWGSSAGGGGGKEGEEWGSSLSLSLAPLRALGEHNARNACAAALIATGLGVGIRANILQWSIKNLCPPPHRMESVGSVGGSAGGVRFVNDSKATNVESTLAGLTGFPYPAWVLLGGKAKEGVAGPGGGLGFERLAPALRGVRGVVTFGAAGPRIAAELEAAGGVPCVIRSGSLAAAVAAAWARAAPGDAVVLSPGCASFDEFGNYEERGEAFRELARGLGAVV